MSIDWDDDTNVDRLRKLWAEGHATEEIGRRMGTSKHSIVGKAHRLGLTARPSPIKRGGNIPSRRAIPRRAPKVTLAITVETAAAAQPPAAMGPISVRTPRSALCCWPIGEPGTRAFRYCDDQVSGRRSYCEAHTAIAYVAVREPAVGRPGSFRFGAP